MIKFGKLKKLWKNRKTLWKTYQGVFWIEAAALAIIIACAAGRFYLERERQEEDALDVMTSVQAAVSTAIESGDEEEVIYKALAAMPNTGDEDADSCWGIGLSIYDEDGEVISCIAGDTVACRWQSYQEPEITTEYFAFNLYFSDEEMTDFFSWYDSYRDGSSSLSIVEMDGYYKGRSFQPLRVVFVDNSTRETVYELESEKYQSWRPATLVSRMADLSQESSGDADEVEYGYTQQYIYTVSAHVSQPVQDTVEGEWLVDEGVEYPQRADYYPEYSDYAVTVTDVRGIGAYQCQVQVNLRYLIRCYGEVRRDILPLAILCECAAVFAAGLYLYFKKKQENIRQMRNTFLCAIAHEMKTPAAVIKNSVECLEAGLQPEKQEHYHGMIAEEAEHMNEMLNRMLIYTQVSDSVYELKKEECSLGKMTHQLCRRYEDMIKNRQISLIWEEQETAMVCCDIALMEMVLDNFISNAVKFCTHNGIIRITVSARGISVFNEGEEISEEEMVHIWEPLYRSDEARTAEDDSLGMGLAISEAILKMHRADYGVKNESGGPEFW
ncbi:MAG: HAMP domain-containing histidine kinase, partial [Lachnospiraceae bacterium]|nr:HAMP domain-containing histidine kinase [Lachnospiraceae bacterium]